ncbi:MAG: hypothetical protein WC648_00810 [Candidatus Paceibacterota bacterium]|jgi:hypothetical protein
MDANLHLIIHNAVSIVSAVVIFGMAFFTFLNGRRRTANIAFSLMLLAANVFIISHVIGVNIVDPETSRLIFMFNMSMFFIGTFFLHAILAMTSNINRGKWILILAYVSSVLLVIFFSVYPDLFFEPSISKMYFPNYYNPGLLNLVRIIFLDVIMVPYAVYILYSAYCREKDNHKRNDFKYMIYTSIIGFGIAFIPNLLVYDIFIDPILGMSFAILCVIPFGYGAIRYEMFNIKVVAKQALVYSIAVGLVSSLIIFLNYLSVLIKETNPNFPSWTIALASALLAVTMIVLVWRSLRENDLLKYEFITTMTHKLRTPLTGIRWAT